MLLDDADERPYLLRALAGEIPLDPSAIDAMSVGRRIFGTGRGRTIIHFPTPLRATGQPISIIEIARMAALYSVFPDELAEQAEEAGAATRGQVEAIAARMAHEISQERRA